jgi:hypothetical protein
VHGQWARTGARSDPIANELIIEQQRASGAAFVCRPLAFSYERAVGGPYGWEIQDCTEVESEAGSAWVVSAGGVDKEDVRRFRESADNGFEQGSFAQR